MRHMLRPLPDGKPPRDAYIPQPAQRHHAQHHKTSEQHSYHANPLRNDRKCLGNARDVEFRSHMKPSLQCIDVPLKHLRSWEILDIFGWFWVHALGFTGSKLLTGSELVCVLTRQLYSFTSDITHRRRNTGKPNKLCAQSAFGRWWRCITGDRFVAVMPWSTMMHALHMLQQRCSKACNLPMHHNDCGLRNAKHHDIGEVFRHRTTQESDNHTYT